MATVSIERYIDASERVYPMECNVFDVASLTCSSSHGPLSPVPCPRSPVPALKINPNGVYPMEVTLKVDLHIPECRPK